MAYYMPSIPSDTRYNNINVCYNVKWNLTGATTFGACVSSVKCSEIQILNSSGAAVSIKTAIYKANIGNPPVPGNGPISVDPKEVTEIVIPDGAEFTIRGITNSHQVSAAAASGTLYGRTQFYSFTPQSSY
tara:strand:+ start:1633 stop:2025 length:393 start_codon:yes stop_codon:yes gene_type:complete